MSDLLLEIFISRRVVSLEKLSGKSLSWLMLQSRKQHLVEGTVYFLREA